MDTLTLPVIEPAAAPVSAAGAIDRAGAKFGAAADAISGVIQEIDKAEVVAQTQEASLQATKGLTDTLHLAESEPYVSPERVEELFGGEVPKHVDLTEPVPGQPDPSVRQRREVIPMHEVMSDVFERQAAASVETAARNVKQPGWQERFRRAAAEDVERARGQMLRLQQAQRLADVEVRTTSQLQQAAAQRNWALYETILNTPENHLNVQMREKLVADYPHLRTVSDLQDRLRGSATVQEVDALISDIAANRVIDPTKKPIIENADGTFSTEKTFSFESDGKEIVLPSIVNGREIGASAAKALWREGKLAELGRFDSVEEAEKFAQARHENEARTREQDRGAFHAALSSEEQFRLTSAARERKGAIISEMLAANKARKEASFQKWGNHVENEIKARMAGKTTGFTIADVESSGDEMDLSDFLALKSALEAETKRPTDFAHFNMLSQMVTRDPAAFASRNLYAADYKFLGDTEFKEALGWQRSIQASLEKGAKHTPPVPDFLRTEVERWVADNFELNPKDSPKKAREFNEKVGRFVKELAVAYRAKPDGDWTYNDVGLIGIRLFGQEPKIKNSARSILAGGIAKVAPVTDEAIAAAEAQMDADADIVTMAYQRFNRDEKPSDATRAMVQAVLMNPRELARVKAQLAATPGANPEDRRQQIQRAVKNITPKEREGYAAEREADEVKARKLAETRAAAEKEKAETTAKRAIEEKAQREARAQQPVWERVADRLEQDARARSDDTERARVGGLIPDQPYTGGIRFGSPVSDSDVARAEALERTRADRYAAIRLQFEQDRAAFREFLENVKAGDSVAKHLSDTLYIGDSFSKYQQLRREGKVF